MGKLPSGAALGLGLGVSCPTAGKGRGLESAAVPASPSAQPDGLPRSVTGQRWKQGCTQSWGSARGGGNEDRWVYSPGGNLTTPKTRKHRQERAWAHRLSSWAQRHCWQPGCSGVTTPGCTSTSQQAQHMPGAGGGFSSPEGSAEHSTLCMR